MGRKKKTQLEVKPFCYYCDREFDAEKVLIMHQKQKHFKCLDCSRKLDTATGLVVHMVQVHKKALNRVPNAIVTRDNPEVVVHGMIGIPEPMMAERLQKVREKFGREHLKRQQGIHWAQTVVAPTFEQFLQQSQYNGLSTVPKIPTPPNLQPGLDVNKPPIPNLQMQHRTEDVPINMPYQQNNFLPGNFPPNGISPNFVPPSMPPNLMPPNVMPPNVMPPNVMPPNVMPPNVMPPNVMPPNVMPPNVMPPHIMPPNFMPPNMMPPNIMPPTAIPPNATLPPSKFSKVQTNVDPNLTLNSRVSSDLTQPIVNTIPEYSAAALGTIGEGSNLLPTSTIPRTRAPIPVNLPPAPRTRQTINRPAPGTPPANNQPLRQPNSHIVYTEIDISVEELRAAEFVKN